MNVDSAEYANIVLSFTRFYDQARSAGMAPLPAEHKRLIGQWIERALSGYWTHGGYMNWDSGLGFSRWHQAKKLGLTQQALIGIASAQSLQPGAKWGALGEVHARPRAGVLRPHRRPRRRHRRPAVLQRPRRPAGGLERSPGRRAHAGQRGAGGRGRARPPARHATAGAVRLRPGHRSPGRDDARVQHRDRGRQPACVPVRRDRPRAALRRQAGDRRHDRRDAARELRRDRARRHWPPRARLAGRPQRGQSLRHAAAADQGAARRGRAGARPRPVAPTPGRSPTCARPAR